MPGATGRYQPKWLVIEDPSCEFLGCAFDVWDLRYTARLGNWPAGIAWKNTETNQIVRYNHLKLSIDQLPPRG